MDLIFSVGGGAAMLAAAALLVGIAGTASRGPRVRPWLVSLFQINTGCISRDVLRGVEPADVVLLVLAGAAYAGFWPGPGAAHVWWMILAIA